jgi:protease I
LYAEKTSDDQLRSLLHEMIENKQRHIQMLEKRLRDLDASESISASAADIYASIQDWLHASDDMAILRRTLGDIQTGVVDSYNLRKQYTDPTSTAIFTEIEADLAQDEQRLAQLYHAKIGAQSAQPARPTTGAAVIG